MTYREAVSRLYSLEFWGIKLGLDNIREFSRLLGNPQDQFISIHIAGTNGKGSVTAFLDSILRENGHRVGRYTSPHLRDFRERIHVDGRSIPRSDVMDFVERFWPVVRREQYTFFETVTAMAFDAFANHVVDLAVVEVGLGGRFDATNVVQPALSVITNIDLDHTDVLGSSRRQIALEKAGIIKEGTPVLLGPLDSSVRRVIEEVARACNAPVWSSVEILGDKSLPSRGSLRGRDWRVPLLGTHQVANAGVALAAAILLEGCGVEIASDRLRAGLNRTLWPGRFQVLPGRPTVVYDVAHNPAGMREVVRTWRAKFGNRRALALFTTRADKDFQTMVKLLAPVVSRWVGCPLPHGGGITEQEMRRMARAQSVPFEWSIDAPTALRQIKKDVGPGGLVLVVGSHYLVGALLPHSAIDSPVGRVRQVRELDWSDICTASQPPE